MREGKVREDVVDCKDLIPSACGDVGIPNIGDGECTDVYFTGISDITINQGVGIDLTEGIHAYDGNGDEIEFTVTPEEIAKCAVGKHTVTYRAMGEGERLLPTICMGKPGVVLGDSSCNEILVNEKRVVTILQADPPRIDGLSMEALDINEAFDPSEGVTAIDDNGNTIGFTYSGNVETLVEGEIASFDTEFDQNALSVVADIEPIQDLHGYDKPWSGGNGKNKWNGTFVNASFAELGSFTSPCYAGNNAMPIKVGTVYTASTNGTLSGIRYVFLDANKNAIGDFVNANSTVSAPTNAVYLRWRLRDEATASGLYQIEEGSTATSWTPYSNICPISGHTECVTSVTGVNMLDKSTAKNGEMWTSTGISIGVPNSNRSALMPAKPNTNYYANWTGRASLWGIYFFDKDKNYLSRTFAGAENPQAIKTPNGCAYIGINIPDNQLDVASLNYPSTDHDYHAYNGTTHTTDLGRTVYGGTLDVVSGVLTVDKRYLLIDGSADESIQTSGFRVLVGIPEDSITISSQTEKTDKLFSDRFSEETNQITYNGGVGFHYRSNGTHQLVFSLGRDGFTTTAAWRQWFADNPTQVVYELATPQTIQLTPQEVALLLGQNNVKASTGEVKVIYQVPMASSGDITYLTEGKKIITYHAEDECGNETSVERDIYVGAYAPITCMANVCKAQVICDNDNQ